MTKILKINKFTGETTETSETPSTFAPLDTDTHRYVFVSDGQNLIQYGHSVLPGDNSSLKKSVLLPPISEQGLSGPIYGPGFSPGELLFQTTILPQLQNHYLIGGISQSEYNPVVASVGFTLGSGTTFGFVGSKCMQFMGTPADSAGQPAATVVLPVPIDSTHLNDFLVTGFLYLSQTPSANYDPVVVGVVNNITSPANTDAWVVDIDSDSTKRVRFQWATTNKKGVGFPNSIYVTPTYGITLNTWHHWAVAYSNVGGSAAVSTYWNGARTATSTSGFSGSFRNNANNRVSVGADMSGYYPLKGHQSNLLISGGSASTALLGFLHGPTAPVPVTDHVAGQYTFALMSGNGPLGQSFFPCDVKNRVTSVCDGVFRDTVYVSSLQRETDSLYREAKGLTAFIGVCGGHSTSGGTTANSYVFGYDSGSCMVVDSVSQLMGLTQAQEAESNRLQMTYSTLFGVAPMVGSCGDTGPLKTLFSTYPTGYAGTSLSFLPNEQNIANLNTLYNYTQVSGTTSTQYITDYFGNSVTMGVSGVVALRTKVLTYINRATTEFGIVQSRINGATSQANLKTIAGFSSEVFVQSLSVLGKDNRSISIQRVNSLIGDFKTPELVYREGKYDPTKPTKPSLEVGYGTENL